MPRVDENEKRPHYLFVSRKEDFDKWIYGGLLLDIETHELITKEEADRRFEVMKAESNKEWLGFHKRFKTREGFEYYYECGEEMYQQFYDDRTGILYVAFGMWE